MTTPSHKLTREPGFGNPRNILDTTTALIIVVVFWSLASACIGQDLRAEKIYGCEFVRSDDTNADQLPDNWRRRRDRQHPPYIEIGIAPREPALAQKAVANTRTMATLLHAIEVGYWDECYTPEVISDKLRELMDQAYGVNSSLEMRMDGSAAELLSPKFPLDSRFGYNLEAQVASEDLTGHEAWIELQLLDTDEKIIDTISTRKISQTTDWTPVSTDVVTDISKQLAWGRIHLKVEPVGYALSNGIAKFDSLRVYRLPRLVLSTPLVRQVAEPGQNIDIVCTAMGISKHCSSVKFELRDYKHELISRESIALQAILHEEEERSSDSVQPHYVSTQSSLKSTRQSVANRDGESDTENAIYDGQATWGFVINEPGLYRVRVDLGEGGTSQRREILLGVIPKHERFAAGPFGWSIPAFDGRITPEQLPGLVEQFGAGCIKLPVWFEATDTATADRLVTLIERLQSLGTKCIGRIDQPPASQRSVFGEGTARLPAVLLFRDSEVWEPVLEPVLTRIGLKLEWFQLDGDSDESLQGLSDVAARLTEVRVRMQNYSQELKLAINWNWLDPNLDDRNSIVNAVQKHAQPQLSAAELLAYASEQAQDGCDIWMSLNPLEASQYALSDRVRDLTERMIAVRRTRIKATFVTNPFDQETGLFDSKQALNEMLIPWMNLVRALGAAEYVGSIQLPNDSINYVFQSGNMGLMLVWNDQATTEQIFLGDKLDITDVWGRTVEHIDTESSGNALEQKFQVDEWPLIVRGVDTNLIKWRQGFEVAIGNLASTLGKQSLPLVMENPFLQNASGTVRLTSKTLLRDGVHELAFQLPSLARQEKTFPIVLKQDASAGKHDLRFDFDISTDKGYRFSIHREITLGIGDVEFKWDESRISPQQIRLRVELTNNTRENVSFDCKIFPAGVPYQRFQLIEAAPGTTVREINLQLGEVQDPSQIWLRCEEIGTGRILNYRIGAEAIP